ncbi:unnamed protein product [Aureobasidium vineae]|uniref:CBF1-interacting co-repressor CIR N-terminal domain-containing protein n=1 Tax=Aureobasidium vineae TaxID=2773715 RepID=A0A9N8PET7_9PEZI|nr:unnamed protein product [Aureobasidium vineae]
MVLHLLGKKSWNVYNRDNVDRVRRDEAAAQAREEEDERRMQEEDAARRTAILRGEVPPPITAALPPGESDGARRPRHGDDGRDRKRRRLRGEDDTDREMRIAKEDAATGAAVREKLSNSERSKHEDDVSLTDHAGHIQLFAAPNERALLANSRNAEAEAEKAKKAREFEDQYTMRFSNAAGFKQSTSSAPWYVSSSKQGTENREPSKDVWGNEDPSRRDREQTRLTSNDPMAFMRKAQTQLKRAETDREKWKTQKERELRELEQAEREERRRRRRERRHKRDRRERSQSVGSLEGFSLEDTTRHDKKEETRSRGDKRDSNRRHKSQSRDGDHRHRSSHRVSRQLLRRRSRSPIGRSSK